MYNKKDTRLSSNLINHVTLTTDRVIALRKMFSTREVTPTGSRHIEWPPKLNTDDDYLILQEDKNIEDIRQELLKNGWSDCLIPVGIILERYEEEGIPLTEWGAFRKDDINIMVYSSRELYEASLAATLLCTKLNIKDRNRRIRIFRWFKFGEPIKKDDLHAR